MAPNPISVLTKNNPLPNNETCHDFEYSLCRENNISKNCVPTRTPTTLRTGKITSVIFRYVNDTNAVIIPATTIDITNEI